MIAETLFRWGFWLRRDHALKTYAAAFEAHRKAVARRDSRRVHQTRQRLAEAMSYRLRVGA